MCKSDLIPFFSALDWTKFPILTIVYHSKWAFFHYIPIVGWKYKQNIAFILIEVQLLCVCNLDLVFKQILTFLEFSVAYFMGSMAYK